MIPAIIVLGRKHGEQTPTPIYVGIDGHAAQKAADVARDGAQFARIERIVNAVGSPLPVVNDNPVTPEPTKEAVTTESPTKKGKAK